MSQAMCFVALLDDDGFVREYVVSVRGDEEKLTSIV